MQTIAEAVIRQLIACLEKGEPTDKTTTILPVSLVVRASSAAVPVLRP
ncbi:hypothetical protein MKQ70_32780 [Chitinophaga sedimenti]|nr:hypothetical protein [Chitinophaga sedimenti]MCK7559491.1 hypothetical protein [Chitinophaga sedimenti]